MPNYPTRYHLPKKAKDPMKHIMREYLPMELEKDERVYGGHDAAVRAGMADKASERWLEILKPFITVTNFAEVGAGRCMSMLMDAVPNNELRNGYHVQFVDEIRHTGMQMSLARWYAKHSPDPAGLEHRASRPSRATRSPRAGAEHALATSWSATRSSARSRCRSSPRRRSPTSRSSRCPTSAARNGDFALPTTYLSVQSDEARHISNGYATLLTVLQDDRNAPLIERDLQQAWWINHAYLDTVLRRGHRVLLARPLGPRVLPGQVGPLDPRRLVPLLHAQARQARPGHDRRTSSSARASASSRACTTATRCSASPSWPLHFWRFDALDEKDFEWFESKYPGWYDEYGAFWEAYPRAAPTPARPRCC